LVVSITVGFCAIFSLVAGFTNDVLGRRRTIMLASALFTVGSAVLTAAVADWMLYLGRAILGAGIGWQRAHRLIGARAGIASMTVPTYVAECSPAHVRGVMIVGFQLMITFGIFLASVLGYAYSQIDPYKVGWR
jgi:SP family myo-inositol transporter-like MFS transporter 13